MTIRASVRRLSGAAAFVSFTALAGAAQAQSPPTPPASTTPATATATPAEPASTAPPSAATSNTTTEPPSATGSHRTAWPWILMGTGIALVVTAAVFQVSAVREDDKRESEEAKIFSLPAGDPARQGLQKSIETHDDAAKSNRTTSLIVGTVGFLTIAGSVVLWFYEGRSDEPAKAAKPLRPTLLPSFGPSYAGASLGASF